MTIAHPSSLSDAALLAAAIRAAGAERRATADLVALLAEVDSRRLYVGQGYPSLFAWCTDALRLSEPAPYNRITAARAARHYPVIFTQLAEGDLTLTTVTLLAAHLTDENHEALLEAARHKTKRDVERLVASLVPQPDMASSLRRLPTASFGESARIPDETALAVADHEGAAMSEPPGRREQHSPRTPPEERTGARRAMPATPRTVVARSPRIAISSRSR